MNITKLMVLAFGFLFLTSGIAYPFVMTDIVDQMRAEIEIKNVAGEMEMTLWTDYRNRTSSSMVGKVGPYTKVKISGKESNYIELSRFNGKYVQVSGEIAMYYENYKKWEQWELVDINPIPPEKVPPEKAK